MTSTTTVTTTKTLRGSRSFDWAEDEDDTFDYESWKVTADTSAPTVEDLGPLQSSSAEDDYPLHLSVSQTANEPSARITTEESSPIIAESPVLSTQSASSDFASTIKHLGWSYKEAQQWRANFAMEESSASPAYPDLSHHNDKTTSPFVRVNYTHNWNKMKVASGKDCRYAVQYRRSPLSQVSFVNERDIKIEMPQHFFKTFSEVALEDIPELALEDVEEEDAEEATTPPTSSPILKICKMDDNALSQADSLPKKDQNDSDEGFGDLSVENEDAFNPREEIVNGSIAAQTLQTHSETPTADMEFDFADVFDITYDAPSLTTNSYTNTPTSEPTTTPTYSPVATTPTKPRPTSASASSPAQPSRRSKHENEQTKTTKTHTYVSCSHSPRVRIVSRSWRKRSASQRRVGQSKSLDSV